MCGGVESIYLSLAEWQMGHIVYLGGDIQSCSGPDVANAQNFFRLLRCIHTKQFLAQCSMSKFVILQQTIEALVRKRQPSYSLSIFFILQQKMGTLQINC
jgi:hypothetical protein